MVEQRRRELIDRLAVAREEISYGQIRIREELSITSKVKSSLREHPLGWLGGTVGAAALLGMIGRGRTRTEKPRPRLGFFRWAIGLAFALAKPSLTKFFVTRFQNEFENRFPIGSSKSMLGAPPQK